MSDEAKQTSELDDEQAELARRYGLSSEDVKRVRGESWAERCDDAERLANLAEPQSIRERARRHLQAMQDNNPNVGELAALAQGKVEQSRRLLEALHPTGDESSEPTEREGPVNFDAGAREPAPLPSDPGQEHNEVVAELLRAKELEGW
jgi:hypothetical protein